jgi:hypothetical protein
VGIGAAEGTLFQSRTVTDFRALDFEMPHLRRDLNDPDLVLGKSQEDYESRALPG